MDLFNNQKKNEEYEEKAKALIGEMTLEEKVSQLINHAPAVERLDIPAYDWWNEALHGVARAGVATVFPQSIGMASAFDEDMMETVGDAVSTEARAKYNMQQKFGDTDIYKGLTFWAPNVNIFRDPRWGRGQETLGEDPYLTSRLGVRYVEGLQGHDENFLKTAACAKHFAVHSGPEPLRHHFNAEVSVRDMHETYLPAFKACVQEAGVEAVMGAYNRTNGEPCCGSKTLLQDILREEYGFKGHVVSDCWAIRDFHTGHMVTANEEESAAMAMNNGCDLNCGSIYLQLVQAVRDGLVEESRIDEALCNLYKTRMKLGMLQKDVKTPFDDIPYTVVDSEPMRALNLSVAEQSVVLLKNDGLLPLSKDKIRTIGVVGPNADSRKALVGNYEGTASRYITVLEGLEDAMGDDVRILYSEGCDLIQDRISGLSQGDDRISEVKGVCAESDVVVVCLGLNAEIEGEEGDAGNQYAGGDKKDLLLPGLQPEILQTAVESGKPVILVMLCGSAMDLSYADEHASAILQAWYPGSRGGQAIANILFGEVSPSAKLPVTFYRESNTLPEFTDYAMKNRTYRYMKEEPLYPFGFGLSYTSFSVEDLAISTQKVTEEGLDLTVTVTNEGDYDGAETVQVYVRAAGADRDEAAPGAQLKALKKVHLRSGASAQVNLHLDQDAFALFDEQGSLTLQKGVAEVYIGTQQPDSRSQKLTGKSVEKISVEVL